MTELSDPELSKTAFERTLLMEERSKMLKQMQRRVVASRLAQINGDLSSPVSVVKYWSVSWKLGRCLPFFLRVEIKEFFKGYEP